MIGAVTTVIETSGIYGLVQVADTYWMGSYGGAELRYGGTPVTAGQFGAWAPIALEPMAGNLSYKVVWKLGATDQYTVWTTDAGLGYVSQTGVLSGSTLAFQSLETAFSQDLNSDGTIGYPDRARGVRATTLVRSALALHLYRPAGRLRNGAFDRHEASSGARRSGGSNRGGCQVA